MKAMARPLLCSRENSASENPKGMLYSVDDKPGAAAPTQPSLRAVILGDDLTGGT